MASSKSREWQLQQEERASWERLRSKPWLPDLPVRAIGSGTPRIQIINSLAFQPASFWEVCQSGSNWILYTARVVALWNPGPLRVQGYERVTFPGEELERYHRRLVSLSLPVAPHLNGLVGLDGSVTQLTLFGDLHSTIQFRWWSDPPPGWIPLVQVVNEMMAAFARLPAGN
jgi:hypothetical protein